MQAGSEQGAAAQPLLARALVQQHAAQVRRPVQNAQIPLRSSHTRQMMHCAVGEPAGPLGLGSTPQRPPHERQCEMTQWLCIWAEADAR